VVQMLLSLDDVDGKDSQNLLLENTPPVSRLLTLGRWEERPREVSLCFMSSHPTTAQVPFS
jgi:hypothetical protein